MSQRTEVGHGYVSSTTEMASEAGQPVPRALSYPGTGVLCTCRGTSDAVKACVAKTAGFDRGLQIVSARNACRNLAEARLK